KKIEKLINKIGLFRNKAKNIYQLSKILIREHNSKVPNDFDKLLALPGVGRKTANVVLNEGFGQSTIAVDTHIFRVSNRTKLAPGKNPDEVEKNLYKVVPPKYLKDAHHLLLLHGRYTCKARTPLCKKCVIEPHCKFNKKKFD
ncbi:MAG: endonuclease III, partial [Proteobacteria bacterium]|nr:endonuclease III [Pseudomonadota bacterium]